MIVFDLKCAKGHLFEAWFRDGATFEAQAKAGEVPCPTCGSTKVEKALMAPSLSGAKKKAEPKPVMSAKAAKESQNAAEVRKALTKLRQTVEENFDYVGQGFAEEARKIHYGETETRNIYGETSQEDAEALDDEGIEVSRIPWLPPENS